MWGLADSRCRNVSSLLPSDLDKISNTYHVRCGCGMLLAATSPY